MGYFIVFVNNILSTLYGQITEGIKKRYDITSVKLLIYSAYVLIFSCSIIIIVTGEFDRLLKYDQVCLGFIFYLVFSCMLTAVLNASYFISNEINSSLFTQLCSNCKDIFITFIGFGMIGDFDFTLKTFLGMIISTAGATVFSFKTLYENIKIRNKSKSS